MLDKRKLLGRMASAGYTQRSLAKAVGISKNTINAKINGNSCFDTDQIDRICRVLNITSGLEKVEIFLSLSSQKQDESADFRD